jgi:hypothetical protein
MRVLFATPMAALVATAGLILGASGPAAAMNISLDGGCTASGASVDGAGNVSISVSCPTTTPPTSGAPAGCKLYASKSTATAGQSFDIYGKCTGGDVPITFALSGTDVPAAQQLVQSALTGTSDVFTIASSTAKTYSFTAMATAANNAGSMTATPVSVTVSSVTQPPSGSIAAACSAAGYPGAKVIQLDWNNQGRVYSKDVGGFGANDVMVLALTVPATATATPLGGALNSIYGGEWIDTNQVSRTGVLTTSPCDFGASTLGSGSYLSGPTFSVSFTIGTKRPTTGTNKYYPVVAPGTTVYVNLRNTDPTQCGGSCNFFAAFK